MARTINNAVSLGYLRRGLLAIKFTEEENAVMERRIFVDDLRAVLIVPWRMVEDKTQWGKGKAEYQAAAAALNHFRNRKAAELRAARRGESLLPTFES